jgi:aquaporin Z
MNKQIAEFVGTFALVFFGCGAAAIGGLAPAGPTAINLLGIASAFGFAIVAMAYGIGPISGCHVNPAVSFGAFVAGRMSASQMISYWIAQVLGAIVGAVVLWPSETKLFPLTGADRLEVGGAAEPCLYGRDGKH